MWSGGRWFEGWGYFWVWEVDVKWMAGDASRMVDLYLLFRRRRRLLRDDDSMMIRLGYRFQFP